MLYLSITPYKCCPLDIGRFYSDLRDPDNTLADVLKGGNIATWFAKSGYMVGKTLYLRGISIFNWGLHRTSYIWEEQAVLPASRIYLYPSNIRIAPFFPWLINKSTPQLSVPANGNGRRLLLPGERCADFAETRRASTKLLSPMRRVVMAMYEALGICSSRCGDLGPPRCYLI